MTVLSFCLSLRSFRLNPQPLNRFNRRERRERKAKPMKHLQSLWAQARQTAYDIRLYHGHGHLEMRKFAWSQDVARRKSKPTFLLSLRSLRSLRFSRRRILSCADRGGGAKA